MVSSFDGRRPKIGRVSLEHQASNMTRIGQAKTERRLEIARVQCVVRYKKFLALVAAQHRV